MMQTANVTGSARIARRMHAGRDASVLERLDDGRREERQDDGTDGQEPDDGQLAALQPEQSGGERTVHAGPDRRERQQVRERRERALVPDRDQHQPHEQEEHDGRDQDHRRPEHGHDPTRQRRANPRHGRRPRRAGREHRVEEPAASSRCGCGLGVAVAAGPGAGRAFFFRLFVTTRPPMPSSTSSGSPSSSSSSRNAGPIRGPSQRPTRNRSSTSGIAAAKKLPNSFGRSSSVGETTETSVPSGSCEKPTRPGSSPPRTPTTVSGVSARFRSSPPLLALPDEQSGLQVDGHEAAGRGRDEHRRAGHDHRALRDGLVDREVPHPLARVGSKRYT